MRGIGASDRNVQPQKRPSAPSLSYQVNVAVRTGHFVSYNNRSTHFMTGTDIFNRKNLECSSCQANNSKRPVFVI